MNYTILAKFRINSILNKRIPVGVCSCLFNNNPTVRFYSLQTTAESAIIQRTAESAIKSESFIFRGLYESAPVELLQNFVVNFHDTSGLPWWATIVCSTLLLRTVITAPLAVYQQVILGRLQNISFELQGLSKELQKEVAIAIPRYKWDNETAKLRYNFSLNKLRTKLILRDNCHPLKTSMLMFVQIPLWVCFSVTLRNLVYVLPYPDVKAQLTFSELSAEGFGWIANLTQPDATFILPICLGLMNLAIIEILLLSRVQAPSIFQSFMTNFFRGISLLMIPIACSAPSCIPLYWATSSTFGLVQNLLLMSPKVKRFCRIPHTPTELAKPYSHIYNNFKKRVTFNFSNIK